MSKTLGEVFRDLSFGHLSNLSIGEEGTGNIMPDKQQKILSFVNQGLEALHSKFLLREGELILTPIEGRTNYPLIEEHALSSSVLVPKFIEDSAENPFPNDVIRVLGVKDHEGRVLALDSRGRKPYIMTRKRHILEIQDLASLEPLSVRYQANHPVLSNPLPEHLIELPDMLYEALEAYVAHRVMSPMNGEEHRAKAMELKAGYDQICEEMRLLGLDGNEVETGHTKLEDRGFI